jgi:hypothetical protein
LTDPSEAGPALHSIPTKLARAARLVSGDWSAVDRLALCRRSYSCGLPIEVRLLTLGDGHLPLVRTIRGL